jgi:hypothetical protein
MAVQNTASWTRFVLGEFPDWFSPDDGVSGLQSG